MGSSGFTEAVRLGQLTAQRSSPRELVGPPTLALLHNSLPFPSSCCKIISPMKALGMVILSHMRSRTSNPDSGEAMAFTIAAMSLWIERWKSSRPRGRGRVVKQRVTVELGRQEQRSRSPIQNNSMISRRYLAQCRCTFMIIKVSAYFMPHSNNVLLRPSC